MPDVQPHGCWPQVRFTGVDGTSVILTVRPREVVLSDNKGVKLCSRTQIPLVLGYAMTVHRAQGQTLPAVIMHVGNLFAYGQLYTGLSRV